MAKTTVTKKAMASDPNLDVTTQDQAMTNEDVDAQDARTRLWQSYNTTYNSKIRDSDKAYDRNISEADNAARARGMGRSSFALQTRANIGQEKINAQNNINSEKIAAYQQALNNLEQQEQEQANWEAQFNLTKDQFAYQQERDKVSDAQWQAQFDEGIRQFNAQLNAAGGGSGGGYSRGGSYSYNPPPKPDPDDDKDGKKSDQNLAAQANFLLNLNNASKKSSNNLLSSNNKIYDRTVSSQVTSAMNKLTGKSSSQINKDNIKTKNAKMSNYKLLKPLPRDIGGKNLKSPKGN